jgi:organic radical activating enzyme
VFLRFAGCNLWSGREADRETAICRFCDTDFVGTDGENGGKFATADALAAAAARLWDAESGPRFVVVTGGEPMLQQSHLPPLLRPRRDHGLDVEIETAGVLAPDPAVTDLVTRFNVSPKLANSGNDLERRYRPEVLRALAATGKAAFKFVAVDDGDLDEIQTMVDECALPATDVWVMPEGTDAATIVERSRALVDPVLARGWNLTTRLHVLLWGDRRGV